MIYIQFIRECDRVKRKTSMLDQDLEDVKIEGYTKEDIVQRLR